jgi:integrase
MVRTPQTAVAETLPPPPLPGWARSETPVTDTEAAFQAGAALAMLDCRVRAACPSPGRGGGAWRCRLRPPVRASRAAARTRRCCATPSRCATAVAWRGLDRSAALGNDSILHVADTLQLKMDDGCAPRSPTRAGAGRRRRAASGEADIEKIHRTISRAGHKHQANRVVAIMSKMFGLALIRARASSATSRDTAKRYLTTDEANGLLAELDRHHDARSVDAIRLLMLTGARRSEVLGMSWGDLDLDDKKTWTRRAENSKGKRASTVPLSPPATELLLAIRAEQIRNRPVLGEFVFPSAASKSRHLVEIKKFWRQVTKAAGLTDIRVHDLRHSFASILVSKGASLPLIGSRWQARRDIPSRPGRPARSGRHGGRDIRPQPGGAAAAAARARAAVHQAARKKDIVMLREAALCIISAIMRNGKSHRALPRGALTA